MICSIVGCSNSTYKLEKWYTQLCDVHGLKFGSCVCQPPFTLFPFPTERKNPEARKRWARLVNRKTPSGTDWQPNSRSRICSCHFKNGEPTPAWPDPTKSLGYDKVPSKSRREPPKERLPYADIHKQPVHQLFPALLPTKTERGPCEEEGGDKCQYHERLRLGMKRRVVVGIIHIKDSGEEEDGRKDEKVEAAVATADPISNPGLPSHQHLSDGFDEEASRNLASIQERYMEATSLVRSRMEHHLRPARIHERDDVDDAVQEFRLSLHRHLLHLLLGLQSSTTTQAASCPTVNPRDSAICLLGEDHCEPVLVRRELAIPCLGKLHRHYRCMCPRCGFIITSMHHVLHHPCPCRKRRYRSPDVVFVMIKKSKRPGKRNQRQVSHRSRVAGHKAGCSRKKGALVKREKAILKSRSRSKLKEEAAAKMWKKQREKKKKKLVRLKKQKKAQTKTIKLAINRGNSHNHARSDLTKEKPVDCVDNSECDFSVKNIADIDRPLVFPVSIMPSKLVIENMSGAFSVNGANHHNSIAVHHDNPVPICLTCRAQFASADELHSHRCFGRVTGGNQSHDAMAHRGTSIVKTEPVEAIPLQAGEGDIPTYLQDAVKREPTDEINLSPVDSRLSSVPAGFVAATGSSIPLGYCSEEALQDELTDAGCAKGADNLSNHSKIEDGFSAHGVIKALRVVNCEGTSHDTSDAMQPSSSEGMGGLVDLFDAVCTQGVSDGMHHTLSNGFHRRNPNSGVIWGECNWVEEDTPLPVPSLQCDNGTTTKVDENWDRQNDALWTNIQCHGLGQTVKPTSFQSCEEIVPCNIYKNNCKLTIGNDRVY